MGTSKASGALNIRIQGQGRMKVYTALLLLFVACSVVCKSRADHSPNCASMRGWYPGIEPKPVTDNTPYKLVVSSSRDHYKTGLYYRGTQHNVTLMRNVTTGDNGTFVGFIIYAKVQYPEDVSSAGNFVKPLPEGVEVDECHDGYMFEVARNSSSKEQLKSVQLIWKPPTGRPAGTITFSASVAEATNVYYEGFKFVLKYECPLRKCYLPAGCPNGLAKDKYGCKTCNCVYNSNCSPVFSCYIPGGCPNGLARDKNGCMLCECADNCGPVPGCNIPGGCPNGLAKDKNGCRICQCAGAGSIGVAFSSFLAVVLVLAYHLL